MKLIGGKLRARIQQALWQMGYDVHRLGRAGSTARPIGMIHTFLEDLRARGLVCQAILDVGANRGDWSRMAKKAFTTADCFLIEPQIEMKPFLDAFCLEYPGSRWFMAGAGAAAGELSLTVYDDLVGSSFLHPESAQMIAAGKQRRLPIITIDSLIGSGVVPKPQIVKLDIQGFELEALRGGALLFGSAEAFVLEVSLFRFLEGQPIFYEVLTFMEDRGYVVYDFPGFLRRPYDGALGQVDVCFVKRDGV
jgi:FkbM family methyltransferase